MDLAVVSRRLWLLLLVSFAALFLSACAVTGGDESEQTGRVSQRVGAPVFGSFTPVSAPQGAVVTVAGNNLAEVTKVEFNGIEAPFTVQSDTSLQVTVPDGAITGKVRLTTADGTSTSPANFKVLPTIGSFTPASGASGTQVVITGTGLTGATSVKFGTVVASWIVVSDTRIETAVPAGAATAKISVSTAGGTASSSTTFVTAPPTITTITASAKQGATVTINGTQFADVSSVAFAGPGGAEVAASFTVSSTTKLQAVVPAGATTGAIRVATQLGSALSASAFKVVPTLSGFTPSNGVSGNTVRLTGTALTDVSQVLFGTAASLSYTVVSDTAIDAVVPETAITGKVSVTTPGGVATSTTSFTLETVTAFSPAASKQGASVTITGTGFVDVTGVAFSGASGPITASFSVVSATKVQAVVPPGTITGPVTVTTALGSATSTASFKVLPVIASFSPANGVPGSPVHVIGTGLYGVTSVSFGAASATPSSLDDTALDVTVPAGASTAKIVVTSAGGSATSAQVFTIQSAPSIASFTPASAVQGATITLSGSGFVGAQATVNGTAATISSVTTTSLKIVVPAGATSGPIVVTNAAGSSTSATNLLIKPSISSFTPVVGGVGGSVIISGGGFTGATSVKFGTKAAVFTVVSDGSINTIVPTAAVTAKISVTTPVAAVSSTSVFTVSSIPVVSGLSPSAASEGSTITLTGSNFAGATAVRFNGTAASFTLSSNTSITATVPEGASSGPISVLTAAGTGTSAASFTVLPAITSFTPGGGGPGTYVSMYGTHLGGATAVKVGTVSATFYVISDQFLYVLVPEPSGVSVTLSVVTPDGTATSATTFSVDRCFDVICEIRDEECQITAECEPATGECVYTTWEDGTACDDGSACSSGDTCQQGWCTGSEEIECVADGCHSDGECDPETGMCEFVQQPIYTSCSDGDACNGVESCDAQGNCVAAVIPALDDEDDCTVDSCDPEGGVAHLPISGCGVPEDHPLPPPPSSFDSAPADLVVGGIEFIDPDSALAGLTVEVSPLDGVAQDLSNPDSAWSIEPTGALPDIVYVRFPLAQDYEPGTTMLLWSRSAASGPFKLQSIARVTAQRNVAVCALSHFSAQALVPLADAGALAASSSSSRSPTWRRERYFSWGEAEENAHALAMSLSTNGSFAFQRESDEWRSVVNGQDYPSSANGRVRIAGASPSHVRTTPEGGIVHNGAGVSSSGTQPSISADGSLVVFTEAGQIVSGDGQLISSTQSGEPAQGSCNGPEISGSGLFVAFNSNDPALDPASPGRGIFVRDLGLGITTRLPLEDEQYGRLQVAQFPHAVSDGGRYVFLQNYHGYVGEECAVCGEDCGACGGSCDCRRNGEELDPSADTNSDSCRTYYRFDRLNLELKEVGHGNWLAVDRSGRTVVYHPCSGSDYIGFDFLDLFYDPPGTHHLEDLSFAPLYTGDMNRNKLLAFGPTPQMVFELNDGETSDLDDLRSFVADYQGMEFGAGAITGDGNQLVYSLNGDAYETGAFRETWAALVPSPAGRSTIVVPDVTEFEPFSITYADMLGETGGDLLVLTNGRRPIEARRTFGAHDGVLEFGGLAAGRYFIDTYFELNGDPPVLKFAGRKAFDVHTLQPTMSVQKACEFEPFTVEFENFLAKEPGDRIVLEGPPTDCSIFPCSGPEIEAIETEGGESGSVTFPNRLDEGWYRLKAEFSLPGDPPTLASRGTIDLHVEPCVSRLVTNPPSQPLAPCQFYPETGTRQIETVGAVLSPDGTSLVYRTPNAIRQFDRRTGVDSVLHDSPSLTIHGFGASHNVEYVGFAIGSWLFVLHLTNGALDVIDSALPAEEIEITISDDGRWVAYTKHLAGPGGATFLAFYDRVERTQLLAEEAYANTGCGLSMSAAGRWLTYTARENLNAGSGDEFYGYRIMLVDMMNPTRDLGGNFMIANAVPVDLGVIDQLGGPTYEQGYRGFLSPSGARLIYSNPSEGTNAFVQNLDGSGRSSPVTIRSLVGSFAALDDGSAFLATPPPDGGLSTLDHFVPNSTHTAIATANSLSALRPAANKRRLVFRGSGVTDQTPEPGYFVAPF